MTNKLKTSEKLEKLKNILGARVLCCESSLSVEIKSVSASDLMSDVFATMAALVVGNPSTQFVLDYKKGDDSYHFDSFEERKE